MINQSILRVRYSNFHKTREDKITFTVKIVASNFIWIEETTHRIVLFLDSEDIPNKAALIFFI